MPLTYKIRVFVKKYIMSDMSKKCIKEAGLYVYLLWLHLLGPHPPQRIMIIIYANHIWSPPFGSFGRRFGEFADQVSAIN